MSAMAGQEAAANAAERWIEVEMDGERRRFDSANAAARELSLPMGSLHSAIRGRRGFLAPQDGRKLALRYAARGGPIHMEDRRGVKYARRKSIRIAVDGVWYGSPSEASRGSGIGLSTLTRAIARGATSVKPWKGASRTIEYADSP